MEIKYFILYILSPPGMDYAVAGNNYTNSLSVPYRETFFPPRNGRCCGGAWPGRTLGRCPWAAWQPPSPLVTRGGGSLTRWDFSSQNMSRNSSCWSLGRRVWVRYTVNSVLFITHIVCHMSRKKSNISVSIHTS